MFLEGYANTSQVFYATDLRSDSQSILARKPVQEIEDRNLPYHVGDIFLCVGLY